MSDFERAADAIQREVINPRCDRTAELERQLAELRADYDTLRDWTMRQASLALFEELVAARAALAQRPAEGGSDA